MLKTGTLEIVRDFQKEVVALVNKFKHSKDSKELSISSLLFPVAVITVLELLNLPFELPAFSINSLCLLDDALIASRLRPEALLHKLIEVAQLCFQAIMVLLLL